MCARMTKLLGLQGFFLFYFFTQLCNKDFVCHFGLFSITPLLLTKKSANRAGNNLDYGLITGMLMWSNSQMCHLLH